MSSLFQPGYLPAQTLGGSVFTGATAAAGVSVPAYNATAQTFGIWNPLGSGVEVILIALDLGVATGTTPVAAGFGLSWLANAGGNIATAAPVSAFTAATPVNLRLGLGKNSAVRFTPSAATITAPVFLKSLGLSFASTTATQGGFQWAHVDFGGAITIPPGNYIGLGGSAAQSGTVIQASLDWMEVPFQP